MHALGSPGGAGDTTMLSSDFSSQPSSRPTRVAAPDSTL